MISIPSLPATTQATLTSAQPALTPEAPTVEPETTPAPDTAPPQTEPDTEPVEPATEPDHDEPILDPPPSEEPSECPQRKGDDDNWETCSLPSIGNL